MFENTVFVVEGPPGTIGRRIASRYSYGPNAEGEKPVVKFDDAGDQRWRYITALEPPVEDLRTRTIRWVNKDGPWIARPLEDGDQSWALNPGWHFPDFATWKAALEDEQGVKADLTSP